MNLKIYFDNINNQIDFILNLFEIDENKRIINSTSPDPYLSVSKSTIQYFQNNVNLVNLINETNYELILNKINFFNTRFSAFPD